METYANDEAAKKLNELLQSSFKKGFNMDQDAINLINENMPTPKFNLFNLVASLACVKFEVKVNKEELASSKKLQTWTVSIEVPQGGRSYSYHVQSEGFQPKTVLLKQPLDRQQTLPWNSRTGKALSIGPVERKTTFKYKLEGTMSNNAHDDANPMATSFKKGGELLKPCVQAACKTIHMDARAIQLVNENIPNDFDNMNKALTVVKTDTRSGSTLETWEVTVDADESKSGERPQAPHFGYEVQGGKSNKITGHVWLLFNPPFFRPWKAGEKVHLGPSTTTVGDYKYVLTGVMKIQRKT